MDFRKKLLKIDTSLGAKEVEALKFLCRDMLPHKKLEKASSALEIFEQLLEEEQLTEEDPALLMELLCVIRQRSLLQHLQYRPEQVQASLPTLRRISPFRKLLYELSEDMDSQTLRSMIFLLPNVFPKTEMTSLSFLAHLEKQDLISEDDLKILEELCHNVAPWLKKKIEKYGKKSSQEMIPPETLHLAVEELSSLVGTMQVCEVSQMEPGQNEPRKTNGSSDVTLVSDDVGPCCTLLCARIISFASLQHLAIGDRTINGAPRPVSREMLGAAADIINPETRTKEVEAYRMDRKHRGCCVIVNNQNFTSLPDRPGTQKDAESLRSVFQWLGLEIEEYSDVTKGDLEEVLQKMQKHPGHTDGDCFVCCILTHGKSGAVYSSDGALIPIQEIISHFTAQRCPSLAHKPKLFFIQACQGDEVQPSVCIEVDARNTELVSRAPSGVNLKDSIPVEADFLLGMATVPGYVSFRHVRNGSWYIQSLCNHLKDLVPRHEDILSILTAVNDDVSRQADFYGRRKQMPQPAFTLRKKLIFPVPQEALSLP
ncbi:caspase-10 [Echinops telfairi]|uniref:Caspase-10 n=1 Tax=Echinops telfairi TaxID=9371 RepID=A0AC55DI47_ECHTE|nr:caspase-10 [Echinops telfairi]